MGLESNPDEENIIGVHGFAYRVRSENIPQRKFRVYGIDREANIAYAADICLRLRVSATYEFSVEMEKPNDDPVPAKPKHDVRLEIQSVIKRFEVPIPGESNWEDAMSLSATRCGIDLIKVSDRLIINSAIEHHTAEYRKTVEPLFQPLMQALKEAEEKFGGICQGCLEFDI